VTLEGELSERVSQGQVVRPPWSPALASSSEH
jgi:hypothetical protein